MLNKLRILKKIILDNEEFTIISDKFSNDQYDTIRLLYKKYEKEKIPIMDIYEKISLEMNVSSDWIRKIIKKRDKS